MPTRTWIRTLVTFRLSAILLLALLLAAGCSPNPQPPGLTPIPTLAPAEPVSLLPALQTPPQAVGQPVEPGAPAEPATPPPAAAGDPANGEVIYTANCLACHGPGAAGGAVGPTLVSGPVVDQPDDYYRETLKNGKGQVMPAWGDRLSAQEIEDVIAYLRSLQ
jgi:mono/diheme cytochrome c family protein